MRLLRFVVADRDQRTGQPTGLLALAYHLVRSDAIAASEADELKRHLAWMEENLPVPPRFARKRNVSHKHTHGLSWVKSDAGAILGRLHAIAGIAERHGFPIEILQTDRPGYVVHEDDWQVVAEPFHGR